MTPRPSPADHRALARIVPRFAGRRILVLADAVVDEFVETDSPRVSREAPVLILDYKSSRLVPGGGANAAANIAALGGVPVVVGEAGDDEAGHALHELLTTAGAVLDGFTLRPGLATPRKTRILAGDKHVALQQVVRIDRVTSFPRDAARRAELARMIEGLLPGVEGVLVSDYGLGLAEPAFVREAILDSPQRSRMRVALDSRFRLLDHGPVDVAAPSEPEVEAALGRSLDDEATLEEAARTVQDRLGAEALLLTRGRLGLRLAVRDRASLDIPAFGDGNVADVTGAGDTVIATLSLALAAGADWPDAARLANAAAGLVVTKMGTATVSPSELVEALETADDAGA